MNIPFCTVSKDIVLGLKAVHSDELFVYLHEKILNNSFKAEEGH